MGSQAKEVIAGACWGSLLAALSFFLMAAGHGVYFPIALISAPFAVFGVMPGLAGTVVLWTGFATLAHKRINAALLSVHYVGVISVSFVTPNLWDFEYLIRSPVQLQTAVFATVLFYVIGQVLIVTATRRAFLDARARSEFTTAVK